MNDMFQSLPDAGYLTLSFTPNVFSVGLVGSMTTSRTPTIKEGLGSHKLRVLKTCFLYLGASEGKLLKYVCSAHAQGAWSRRTTRAD